MAAELVVRCTRVTNNVGHPFGSIHREFYRKWRGQAFSNKEFKNVRSARLWRVLKGFSSTILFGNFMMVPPGGTTKTQNCMCAERLAHICTKSKPSSLLWLYSVCSGRFFYNKKNWTPFLFEEPSFIIQTGNFILLHFYSLNHNVVPNKLTKYHKWLRGFSLSSLSWEHLGTVPHTLNFLSTKRIFFSIS